VRERYAPLLPPPRVVVVRACEAACKGQASSHIHTHVRAPPLARQGTRRSWTR
jgi:hypothetical protein